MISQTEVSYVKMTHNMNLKWLIKMLTECSSLLILQFSKFFNFTFPFYATLMQITKHMNDSYWHSYIWVGTLTQALIINQNFKTFQTWDATWKLCTGYWINLCRTDLLNINEYIQQQPQVSKFNDMESTNDKLY